MENLITAAEVGRRMGVSRTSVSTWCKQGRVPGATKVATIWLIPESSIDKIDRPKMGRPTSNNTNGVSASQ